MAERLALAARAHGLGSIVATLKNDGPAEVKKLLGIPEGSRTVVVVPIGNIDREARLLAENAMRFSIASNFARAELNAAKTAIQESK